MGSFSVKEDSKMSPPPCPIPAYLMKSQFGVEILYFSLCNKVDILKRVINSVASLCEAEIAISIFCTLIVYM